MTPKQAEAAIAYAAQRGASDGANAADWSIQDALGGRATGDVRPTARRILTGIDDGDPIVLDTFPFADLSGEWADTLTGPELVDDALYEVRRLAHFALPDSELEDEADDIFTDICDAYEVAFSQAVEDTIAQAAHDALADDETDEPPLPVDSWDSEERDKRWQ